MFGMDAGSLLNLEVKTGKDVLKSLSKYPDSKNTARTWYGSTHYREFVTKDLWLKRLFRDRLSTPEIERVVTVRDENWLLIIGEALPAAHTWFRSREDLRYECSWVPVYLAYKDPRSLCESKQMLQNAELSFSSLGIVNSRPAARRDLWGLVVMAYANGAWSICHVNSTMLSPFTNISARMIKEYTLQTPLLVEIRWSEESPSRCSRART